MLRAVGLLVATMATCAAAVVFAAEEDWAARLFPRGTSHDFGTVERGTEYRHRFAMLNIYNVPIEVTEIRTTCGCLNCKAPKRLQPGESGTFDVTLDTRRFTGNKNFTVYVTVGPKYISTATLKLSASSK
jgi:hypothetical protein